MAKEEARAFPRDATDAEPEAIVLVEPVLPQPLLIIAGGGHVGQALARQATDVGFDVIVLDDRPEFARPELFPGSAAARCGELAEEMGKLALEGETYVVIVTRGHQHDAEALAASRIDIKP